MNIPTREIANKLLEDAGKKNPGPWISHSKYVAIAAESIAKHHPIIDPNSAYILGLLHDIGRYAGVTELRHTIDGYRFLQKLNYDDAARICITHSYPVQDPQSIIGKYDFTDLELEWLKKYLSSIKYDIYDQLIQLCDSISMPTGICLLEKRLIDVAMRYHVNDFAKERWKAFFDIKSKIEKDIGQSIYKVLPGVIENTFEFMP